jgi:putative toxin-antitoxin system antitoxin component (TIGR02293 family)
VSTESKQLVFSPSASPFAPFLAGAESLYSALSGILGQEVRCSQDLVSVSFDGVQPRSVNKLNELADGALNLSWIISERALAHRIDSEKPLTQVETEKVIRLAKVLIEAIEVFGNREKALRWLKRPHRFNGLYLSPLELCKAEEGASLVRDKLRAIDHGFSA